MLSYLRKFENLFQNKLLKKDFYATSIKSMRLRLQKL